MTHLDLFTGIGGFHLAAEWAGFETIGFSEIEPYCCQLLAEKWPEIKNYGDICTADFSGLRGRIAVLSAGVPCQPSSLAGKRRGAKDDRWLWPATLDVVRAVEPAWCIFENPVGIGSLDEFADTLSRLGSLGYSFRLFRVSANAIGANFEGYRLFIVASANGNRSQRSKQPVSPMRNRREFAPEVFPACSLREAIQNHLPESYICGAGNGLPDRSHRLKALGNAVVPQQVFPFFQAICQVEN
jgi:DNA (cytosine-5)-methyltransferase 1